MKYDYQFDKYHPHFPSLVEGTELYEEALPDSMKPRIDDFPDIISWQKAMDEFVKLEIGHCQDFYGHF